jgi:hypothetical protein
MPRFERVCPECGTSNAYDKTQCVQCRAPLTGAVDTRKAPPAPLSRKAIAKLTWRAAKFVAGLGVQLARRGAQRGIDRVTARPRVAAKDETIEGDYVVPPPEPPAASEYFPPLREWRVWSGDADDESSDAPASLHWGAPPKQKTR